MLILFARLRTFVDKNKVITRSLVLIVGQAAPLIVDLKFSSTKR